MADWSQLPRELLDVISKHLVSETDLLRFRSVCTSWRSSIQPFSSRFPILPNAGISDTTWGFYLSKRTIFRLGLPDSHSNLSNSHFNNPNSNSNHPNSDSSHSNSDSSHLNSDSSHPNSDSSHPNSSDSNNPNSDSDSNQTLVPWLIKVERDNPQKTHLMNPLTGSEFIPLLPNFPRSLNLLNFRVTELGQEYALQYISYRPNANSIGDSVTLYMEKVAFCSNGVDGFILLTIHVSGKLALLKTGERKWNIINDLPSPYDDVIFYNNEFYAVDSTGRTVIIDPETTSLKVVAGSVFGGDKKFLVESVGDLFMVDKHLAVGPDNEMEYEDENYEFYEDFDCFMSERTMKLQVYKLDKEGLGWVEVKDLGDRMLFLGDNCGFSASAVEFPGCKGNCVFFTGQNREDDGLVKSRGVGVFDLESGNIGAIPNDSGYSQLFWPPPRWLHSDPLNLELEDGLDHLNI